MEYTVDELLSMKTIVIDKTYGELKISNHYERVFLNGRRIAVERYIDKGDYWRLSIR